MRYKRFHLFPQIKQHEFREKFRSLPFFLSSYEEPHAAMDEVILLSSAVGLKTFIFKPKYLSNQPNL